MHRWRGFFIVVAVAVAAACSSSSGSDPDLEAWTREVRVLTPAQVGDREFEEIAALEEQERVGFEGETRAADTAKDRLRRRAAKLDADAVVIVACGLNVRSMDEVYQRTVEPTVICQGVAIRWRDR